MPSYYLFYFQKRNQNWIPNCIVVILVWELFSFVIIYYLAVRDYRPLQSEYQKNIRQTQLPYIAPKIVQIEQHVCTNISHPCSYQLGQEESGADDEYGCLWQKIRH